MFAGDRPVFDFDGARHAADRLATFADEYRDTLADRFETRNSALDEWEGVLANNFSQRADDENQTVINVLLSLRQESDLWVEAWVKAVNIMNNVLYAEAVDAQEKYRTRVESERGFLGQAWNGIDDFLTGSDTAYEEVPKPKETDRPSLEELRGFGPAAFAKYERSGDTFTLSYTGFLPGVIRGEG